MTPTTKDINPFEAAKIAGTDVSSIYRAVYSKRLKPKYKEVRRLRIPLTEANVTALEKMKAGVQKRKQVAEMVK